eukprot:403339062
MLAKLCILSTAAVLLLTDTVSASAYDFPSFDIFHSKCGINVNYKDTLCYNAYNNLVQTLTYFIDNHDPANGHYTFKEKQAISYVWATHISASGWASDNIFETNQLQDGSCQISARSRTKSMFHEGQLDNFCDLWNVLNDAGTISNQGIYSCSYSPADPMTQCHKNTKTIEEDAKKQAAQQQSEAVIPKE